MTNFLNRKIWATPLNILFFLILSTIAGTLLIGCATYKVVSMPNRNVIALTADDIVLIMNRAGFTKDETIELGTDIRNALATTGSARAMLNEKTAVVFTAQNDYVYVNSRKRGGFTYDVEKKSFK